MNPIVMQVLDLMLLTLAAGVVGYKLAQRAKPSGPAIGKRVTWLKPTSKGNYRPMQAIVRAHVGNLMLLEALDLSARGWMPVDRFKQ